MRKVELTLNFFRREAKVPSKKWKNIFELLDYAIPVTNKATKFGMALISEISIKFITVDRF